MKIAMSLLAAVFLIASVAAEEPAPKARNIFTDISVSMSSADSPLFRNTDNTLRNHNAKNTPDNQWAVIFVEFTPRIRGDKTSWIDGAKMNVSVAFEGQSGGSRRPMIFTGTTEFWTVPLDGKKHVAMMALPPHLLDRYLPSTGVRSKIDDNSIIIEVVFTDAEGGVIGQRYDEFGRRIASVKGSLSQAALRKMFERLRQSKPDIISGAVKPRKDTPWGLLYPEEYDYLK